MAMVLSAPFLEVSCGPSLTGPFTLWADILRSLGLTYLGHKLDISPTTMVPSPFITDCKIEISAGQVSTMSLSMDLPTESIEKVMREFFFPGGGRFAYFKIKFGYWPDLMSNEYVFGSMSLPTINAGNEGSTMDMTFTAMGINPVTRTDGIKIYVVGSGTVGEFMDHVKANIYEKMKWSIPIELNYYPPEIESIKLFNKDDASEPKTHILMADSWRTSVAEKLKRQKLVFYEYNDGSKLHVNVGREENEGDTSNLIYLYAKEYMPMIFTFGGGEVKLPLISYSVENIFPPENARANTEIIKNGGEDEKQDTQRSVDNNVTGNENGTKMAEDIDTSRFSLHLNATTILYPANIIPMKTYAYVYSPLFMENPLIKGNLFRLMGVSYNILQNEMDLKLMVEFKPDIQSELTGLVKKGAGEAKSRTPGGKGSSGAKSPSGPSKKP